MSGITDFPVNSCYNSRSSDFEYVDGADFDF